VYVDLNKYVAWQHIAAPQGAMPPPNLFPIAIALHMSVFSVIQNWQHAICYLPGFM
jgi:hypothetical protein